MVCATPLCTLLLRRSQTLPAHFEDSGMTPTIINRAAAKAAALNKYFTGEECTNGHISERYVQSGACCACISAHVYNSRRLHADEQTTPRAVARREFHADTVSVKVRLPMIALPRMLEMAAALLQARFPLLVGDGRISFTPSPKVSDLAAGVATVRLLAHKDDAATIQGLAAMECSNFGGAIC